MLIDKLDRLYTNITDKNTLLNKLKFYSMQRLIIRLTANVIIPAYYLCTKSDPNAKLNQSSNYHKRYIVSLTTFPARINRVWIVIESLLRQSHKPDMIILWLSKDQFKSLDDLPKTLLQQRSRGLDIRFTGGDLRSHKKYYYALMEYRNDFIITVDDDIFYPTKMIEMLFEISKEYPTAICCHRALLIKAENDRIMPYSQWVELKHNIGPNKHIFFTSGGGTLFPPHSLHQEVLNDNVFKKICFHADDVWLNAMCRLNNTTIVKTDYHSCLLPVMHYIKNELSTININSGKNDSQIEAVQIFMKEVKENDSIIYLG